MGDQNDNNHDPVAGEISPTLVYYPHGTPPQDDYMQDEDAAAQQHNGNGEPRTPLCPEGPPDGLDRMLVDLFGDEALQDAMDEDGCGLDQILLELFDENQK